MEDREENFARSPRAEGELFVRAAPRPVQRVSSRQRWYYGREERASMASSMEESQDSAESKNREDCRFSGMRSM